MKILILFLSLTAPALAAAPSTVAFDQDPVQGTITINGEVASALFEELDLPAQPVRLGMVKRGKNLDCLHLVPVREGVEFTCSIALEQAQGTFRLTGAALASMAAQ
jgi:hypothetical protein